MTEAVKTNPENAAARLEVLRHQLKAEGIDGFLVPRADAYLGEYVAPDSERLLWLTAFSGSAGMAAVLTDKAAIFTDSRYTIQLSFETDANVFAGFDSAVLTLQDWLLRAAAQGAVIGFDPWLHSPKQIDTLQTVLSAKQMTLKPLPKNPIDALWTDRPPAPASMVRLFPQSIAGLTSLEKRKAAAATLKAEGVAAAIITQPDSLAWLLNIRGQDTAYTPLALSYGVLHADHGRVTWFIDPRRVPDSVRAHIGEGVEVTAPSEMEKRLGAFNGLTVGLDHTRSPLWFKERLIQSGAQVKDLKDPCIDPKAIKTEAEQSAIRAAHVYDGIAVTRLLHWLDTEAALGKITEIDVDSKLQDFRRESVDYRAPSFPTIAGFGPHGAIVHYRAQSETAAVVAPGGLLLLDSGGQYAGDVFAGTTDITRTIFTGAAVPEPEHMRIYTLVLKAHIAVARAVFPAGTKGVDIDALARAPLKAEGLDYGHGTGHGVGCYLSVHEEAASLSPRGQATLKPGMLLSNEPGYYKEGGFGVRIENLVLVQQCDPSLLCFETVTLVPFDRKLIDVTLLTAEEKTWVNDYHRRVYETLSPLLAGLDDRACANWLARETAVLP